MKTGIERIESAFAEKEKPLLVSFTVAGDPGYETSLAIMREMAASGSGIIELGLPFSDPVADGPVIQRADLRALNAGMNTDRLFDLVTTFRKESDIPVVILTYTNLIMRRGIHTFYRDAAHAGIDGVVIADAPFEEARPFISAAREFGIAPIMMISPTTSQERLASIASEAEGFVYLVAVMGITGERTGVDEGARELLRRVKELTPVPVAPGFGISTREQMQIWNREGADAIIVGSAIVRLIEENIHDDDAIIRAVGDYIREMTKTCGD